jgi:hypothetical protein
MPRRTQRLIATLLIWLAVLITAGTVLSRIASPITSLNNAWYGVGNIVADGDVETANRLMNDLQQLANSLWPRSQQLAQEAYGQYIPWLMLMVGIILVGGMTATYIIWRSVYLPELPDAVEEPIMRAGKRRLQDDDDDERLEPARQPRQQRGR